MGGALPELLERAAEERPDAPAVVADTTLTYRELGDLASRVAGWLAGRGVVRGDRVGVCAPKSAEVVAALYGIMRVGAAYVPIDPASPASRARHIASDCGIAALVADADRRDLIGAGVPTLPIEGMGAIAAGDASQAAPGPDDLAYLLYTSGSTGSPKGVMLTHGNALTFVSWAAGELGLGPGDRLSSHAPLHFDLSVFDLYAAASVGASVHPVPGEAMRFGSSTAAFVRERAITVWYSVPSALVQLVTHGGVEPDALRSLRHVVFAGEVLPTPYVRRLRALVPDALLHNWYGPTETNVCTYHVVTDEDLASDDPIPIGRPCPGYPTAIEDGELVVGGPAVTPGYWGDAARSAEALFTGPDGGRWYRTGDLVVLGADGEYRFQGRRDHQVKVRGHRVELGEVEAAIHADERVREACVVAVASERLGNELIAFVAGRLEPVEVKRAVALRLPRYMVPARVELADELPKTSTGKIDRRALEEAARG
jgi:amino acid adenylation domain-containing protein